MCLKVLILLLTLISFCAADCTAVLARTATAQATATVVSSYQQLSISKDRERLNEGIIETTSSLKTSVLSIRVDTDTAWSMGMRYVDTSNVPVIIRDSEQMVIENDVELTHKVSLIFAGGDQSFKMSWEILIDPLLFLGKTEKLHYTQLEIILFAH